MLFRSADVYVCGDGHALAPAWKTLDLGARGIARLRPALVTGLKHWHLRAEGSFYPKRNFYAVVGLDAAACSSPAVAADLGLFPGAGGGKRDAPAGTIPRGATVLFVLGEIDCREGILVAVEKLRYPDVDAGIAATVREIAISPAGAGGAAPKSSISRRSSEKAAPTGRLRGAAGGFGRCPAGVGRRRGAELVHHVVRVCVVRVERVEEVERVAAPVHCQPL